MADKDTRKKLWKPWHYKKAAVVKKLEETLDITTDDSLLEKDVHDWMTSKTYCMEKLTILAKYSEKAEEKVHQKYKEKSGYF